GQLQCDGVVGGGGDTGAACQVSSNFGGAGGGAGVEGGDPLASFLGTGTGGVFDASLLDAALAFSRKLGDGGAESNGAMFSGYSGTTGGNISSGESNNYSGGGVHDSEVVSPTSITAPPTLPHASSSQQ